jgi:hypothetical protein
MSNFISVVRVCVLRNYCSAVAHIVKIAWIFARTKAKSFNKGAGQLGKYKLHKPPL